MRRDVAPTSRAYVYVYVERRKAMRAMVSSHSGCYDKSRGEMHRKEQCKAEAVNILVPYHEIIVSIKSLTSTIFAAWLVLPLASSVEKQVVCFPKGKLLMKGDMSTEETPRPSSARTLTELGSATQYSRPSSGTLL